MSFGNDIMVADGETAGDIACVFCSVHVHGDVRGDRCSAVREGGGRCGAEHLRATWLLWAGT